MLIVLDTNIIVENWQFDKSYHRAFLDYIGTVNCEVVFPQIVWSEIESLYRSQLKDALNKQATADRNVSKFLVSKEYQSDASPYVDVNDAYNNFALHLLEQLRCGPHSILEYPSNILPILAEKAIARIKPFSSKGEEFRDAILWQSVLEMAQEYDELNPVIFISNNSREFSDDNDKNKLHPELQIEVAKLNNRTVLYYPSLESFIKSHLTPIEHIKWVWIADHIKEIGLNEIIAEYINERRNKIMPYFTKKYSKITFDTDFSGKDFQLRPPGLSFVSQEDAVYTYKNGEISIFADFEGTISFGTIYYPNNQGLDFAQSEIHNNIGLDFYPYVPEYTELLNNFNVQIELKLEGSNLAFSGVASFKINYFGLMTDNWRKYNGSGTPIFSEDDDDDLPF